MNKRLYKSKTDRVIFGVCGGIAEYFNVDPVLVRLFMVIFALTAGAGILFYIFAAIIMREESPEMFRRQANAAASDSGDAESYSDEFRGAETAGAEASASHAAPHAKRPRTGGGRSSGAVIAGLILILIGVFYLINRFVPIFYWVDFRTIFAAVLVLLGIYFVAKR